MLTAVWYKIRGELRAEEGFAQVFDSVHLPHGRVEVLVNLEQTLSTVGSVAPGSNQTLPVLR